jgi:ABC-type transport system involved in multi-copper enzyme maturation permease subunit
MGNALRAEFLKVRKRPATWVLLGLVIADVLFWQYFLGYGTWLQIKAHVLTVAPFMTSPLSQPFSTTQIVRAVVDQVFDLSTIALILGALTAGSAYGWGTVKTELTAGEPRLLIFAAQFLVLALLFLPLVPLLFGVAVGLTFLLSSLQHFPMLWPPLWQFPAAMGSIYLNLVLSMAEGLMLATVARSAAVGIGLGMGPVTVLTDIPGFIGGPSIENIEQQWLPWPNALSLTFVFGPLGGGPSEILAGVPQNAAGPILIVLGYTLVFLSVGAIVLRRRDVT